MVYDQETINETIERILERAFAEAERARNDIHAALAAGKEIVQVLCGPEVNRGDTIDITQIELEEGEEEEKKMAVVIACREVTDVNKATMELTHTYYAWCIVLKKGESTSEEAFADLYSDEDEEPEEEVDPNVCSCGANREMCARNQNVFGGHLNEE